MDTIVAVCLCLIVVELAIVIFFFVGTMLHFRQAARAVEVLTYRVDEEVDHFGTVMRSGWLRAIQAGASVLAGLWSRRER